MGWLTGLAGNFSEDDLQKVKSFHQSTLFSFKDKNIYISAGGIEETCLRSFSKNQKSGWIVCGLGIKYDSDNASFMNIKDWDEELRKKNFSPYHLNGHFAAARWNENQIELFTDQLGVRKIYVTQTADYTAFTTNPELIIKLNKDISIDWEIFGSRWLLFNQITNKTFLKNVHSLNQGGRLLLNLKSLNINITNKNWHPDLINDLPEKKDFLSVLKDFTIINYNNKNVSLALSGGLDSRLLFAFLISNGNKNFSVHSLNENDHPDTKIAAEISERYGIEQIFFEPSIPSPENIILLLSSYTGETLLAPPVSKYSLMQFYSILHNHDKIVIDGTYGEFARRRFLNNILLKGRKALYGKDYNKLISLLSSNRPLIFNDEYYISMKNGLNDLLYELFDTMPPVKEYGIQNWLELFMIRNHLVTTTAEQARSDKMLVNYMPFIQPSLLKIIFQTPAKKKNNKLFIKAIKELSPGLSETPLVKGTVTYPFGLGTLATSVYVRLKSKVNAGYKDNLQNNFLNLMKEYVLDTLNSTDFLSCEYYNHNKIKNIVEGYYLKKDLSFANDLDWWLTFDIWKRNFN